MAAMALCCEINIVAFSMSEPDVFFIVHSLYCSRIREGLKKYVAISILKGSDHIVQTSINFHEATKY